MILTDNQRSKYDENNDSEFYSTARYTQHLDKNFRDKLTKLYEKIIDENSVVLDLMSSWVSHLPKKKYKKVIGHGMNLQELQNNKVLNTYWVQNFNIKQEIPIQGDAIDYCLIVAGWQYLQYPENLSKEIYRILRKGGKLIISFSNRAFWNKTPSIWRDSSEENRVNYIKNILISNKWKVETIIIDSNQKKSFINFYQNNTDPFYSIIVTK